MKTPEHLPFSERKVYALNSAYNMALRRLELDGNEPRFEGLAAVVSSLTNARTQSLQSGHHVRLDQFLSDAVDQIDRVTDAYNPNNRLSEISAVIAEMRSTIGLVQCDLCGNGQVCRGLAGPDFPIVHGDGGGLCISEIKEAFLRSLQIAEAFFVTYLSEPLPIVEVDLATKSIGRPHNSVPGFDFAINGMTFYDDVPAPAKKSIVKIDVSPKHWDKTTSSAVLYFTLHEVLAHCWQMARYATARPKREAVADPVSEGMIDAIVVKLLQKRARDALAAGDPDARLFHSEADVANEIHLARSSRDKSPRFSDWSQVASGAYALRQIEVLYEIEFGTELGQIYAINLAADLNVFDWNFDQRYKGVAKLLKLLSPPGRDGALIRILLDYPKNRQVRILVDFLTTD